VWFVGWKKEEYEGLLKAATKYFSATAPTFLPLGNQSNTTETAAAVAIADSGAQLFVAAIASSPVIFQYM